MGARLGTWVVWGVINHQRRMDAYLAAQVSGVQASWRRSCCAPAAAAPPLQQPCQRCRVRLLRAPGRRPSPLKAACLPLPPLLRAQRDCRWDLGIEDKGSALQDNANFPHRGSHGLW
jgi:hypothetical protein